MVKKRYFLLISLVILLFDQITKYFVVNYMSIGQSLDFGLMALTRVHNQGAGFGILKDFSFALTAFGVFVLIVSFYYFFKSKNSQDLTLFSMFIAGVAGNLIDRFRFGYVIDFIDFKWWPVFNIADTCITLAILLFIYREFKKK